MPLTLKPPEATETETTKPAGKEEPVKEGKPAPVVVSKIGKGVYEDKCLVCHAANGSGKTETSEFLDPKPPDFSAKSFKLKELIEFIRDGKGEAMPAYKDELSEEETKEVSKYIGGFRK